jgi:phosphatidate cytidylyltransferase
MLGKRVVTVLWSLPLLAAAVWFDAPLPWLTVFLAVCGVLAALEFYRMTGVAGARPLACFGLVWTLVFILYPHFPAVLPVPLLPLLLAGGIVLSLVLLVVSPPREGAFKDWAWMVAGVLYVGWLLSCIVALRLEAGRGWVFLALLATFASDTAAYFIGRALGRHKLAPRISPGKTWEGSIAGVIGAVGIAVATAVLFDLPINYAQMVVLGVVIGVFGQFGDLAESLLKRNMGVKDSGTLMPGHGGLLDRMDSVVFAGVMVYLYYCFFVL